MDVLWVLLTAVALVVFWRLWAVKTQHGRLLGQTVDAFRLGDGEEGERLFERLKQGLSGVRDRLEVSDQLMRARAYEHALEVVEKALELKPGDKRARRLKVRLYGKILHPDASRELRSWLEESPMDHDVALEFGEMLLRLRRAEEAVGCLVPRLAFLPKDVRLHSLLGRVLFHAGELERAQAHLHKAQELRRFQQKQFISIYYSSQDADSDFRFAAEGRWEVEQDRLLLAQIEDGSARAPIARERGGEGAEEVLGLEEAGAEEVVTLDASARGSV